MIDGEFPERMSQTHPPHPPHCPVPRGLSEVPRPSARLPQRRAGGGPSTTRTQRDMRTGATHARAPRRGPATLGRARAPGAPRAAQEPSRKARARRARARERSQRGEGRRGDALADALEVLVGLVELHGPEVRELSHQHLLRLASAVARARSGPRLNARRSRLPWGLQPPGPVRPQPLWRESASVTKLRVGPTSLRASGVSPEMGMRAAL